MERKWCRRCRNTFVESFPSSSTFRKRSGRASSDGSARMLSNA